MLAVAKTFPPEAIRSVYGLGQRAFGENYVHEAVEKQRVLADLADIESSTKLSQGKPSGKVHVETAAAIATMVIVPALGEFYRDYPDVHVELGVGNRRSDLVAEGVDCAIRAGEISEQMIVARQIGAFHFMTCATPELSVVSRRRMSVSLFG